MSNYKFTGVLLALFLMLSVFTGCANDPQAEPDEIPAVQEEIPAASEEVPPAEEESASAQSADTEPAAFFAQADLVVSVQDVGEGDSTFIILPNDECILIDAGNPGNSGSIIEYIKDSGKDTIDYIIATHPHADHIGGMSEVIKAFDVNSIYMPKEGHTTKTFENLLDTIEAKGLKIKTAKAGVTLLDEGGLKAELIAPIKDSYSNINNYAAVLMLTYNDFTFLFMGDVEKEIEAEIIANNDSLKADVLLVGHHGSKTASSKNFISAIRPSVAIISVGDNNYGHPAPETLATLNEYDAEIWRTDEKGTVVVTCDGEKISITNIANNNKPKSSSNSSKADKPDKQVDKSDKTKDDKKSSSKDSKNITVYITPTGSKYHNDGCRYLNKNKISVKLKDLDKNKYRPCSVCKPPA